MVLVDALPAEFGDCLWIEYGDAAAPSVMLIDGGLGATAERIRDRLRRALEEHQLERLHIRLFVITHIDKDHINGALAFLQDPGVPVEFEEIWFNGPPQLCQELKLRNDLLGFKEGEKLSELLADRYPQQWNKWTNQGAIVIPKCGALPEYPLDANTTLTLLGPSHLRLQQLADKWPEVMAEFAAANDPRALADRPDLLGKSERWPPQKAAFYDNPDDAVANGSSIAFLLQTEGRRLVFTGDAFAEDLLASLERLPGQDEQTRVAVDLFKLPHHGSERNFSPALATRLDCARYLISTNCVSHRHPNFATILRIVEHAGRSVALQFNYEADKTTCWRDNKDTVPASYRNYETEYPADLTSGHRNLWP